MEKFDKLKKRVFDIIQIGNKSDFASTFFDIFIVVVIVLNIATTFLQTFDQLAPVMRILDSIEMITMIIFLIEYVLRLWTANYLYPNRNRAVAMIKFAVSFYGIVDILTFLPYFLPFMMPGGAVAFRMFRVVRILHLFRINSHYDAFNVITDVIKDKKDQLFSSIFIILVLMLASSLCMYSLEHDAQPENFANAFSGVWWSVSTLLTVGYGDIYPITVGGRIMAIMIAFLGVGIVAIPTGIISAGFVEYFTAVKVGAYKTHEAAFVTLQVSEEHPYKGLRLCDLNLPKGLFVAVVVRGDDVCTAYPALVVEAGDVLLLGSSLTKKIDCQLDEVSLEPGHKWIGYHIKDLDISRQSFIIAIKRKGRNIKPEGSTILKSEDVILMLTKKRI